VIESETANCALQKRQTVNGERRTPNGRVTRPLSQTWYKGVPISGEPLFKLLNAVTVAARVRDAQPLKVFSQGSGEVAHNRIDVRYNYAGAYSEKA
jgi:hypothetical protein